MRSRSSISRHSQIRLSESHTPSLLHSIINDEMTQMRQGDLPIFKTMLLYNEFKRQQNMMNKTSAEKLSS